MIIRYGSYFFIAVYIICLSTTPLQAQLTTVDSAKNTFIQPQSEDAYLRTAFFIADEYMNVEQYDSAQIWLNKIYEKVPAKKSSLFNYFLITRQAEVYYYNDLQQLGLQESYRGLQMAQDLKDSLLLADSYNFLGLFYMNVDSSAAAIPFYKNGLRYSKQPPYPKQYLSLSKPHHLYGNMSEAFYKLGMYDSALHNIFLSLKKAYEINWGRGIAVGYNSAGDIFSALHKYDSALYNYQKSKIAAVQSKDIDIELICQGGTAKAYYELGNYTQATLQLNEGFAILKKYPNLNRYYSLKFLASAIQIYKRQNDNGALAKTLEIKSAIEAENLKNNNTQLQTMVKGSSSFDVSGLASGKLLQ